MNIKTLSKTIESVDIDFYTKFDIYKSIEYLTDRYYGKNHAYNIKNISGSKFEVLNESKLFYRRRKHIYSVYMKITLVDNYNIKDISNYKE
jgi:(p)ppGpp synthase/HD superfamily hydrolase